MTLPVLVINRARDTARLKRFTQKATAHGITPHRIAAIDGHRADCPFAFWSHLIGDHFWGKDRIKPGALACYLSHRLAWRHIVETGVSRALICEDDCDLTEPLDRIEGVASDLEEFDILFANDRMAGDPAGAPVASVADALAAITARAPGGDCYLLTRRGAERLLALTDELKIVCGVDWAMVWHCLDPNRGLPQPELETLRTHLPARAASLVGHVLTTPVGRLNRDGPSSIDHSSTVPIADLTGHANRTEHGDFASHLTFGTATLSFVGRATKDPVMEAHRTGILWEREAIASLIRLMPEGGVFADIGAHVGNHAVAVGKLAAAQVIAVEPNPEIRGLIEMNLALNGLTRRTRLHETALGAEASQGVLSIHRRKPAASTLVRDIAGGTDAPQEAEGQGKARHAVDVITGDDLIGDGPLDALKIDTNGREFDTLKGFRRTLERTRSLVLIDHTANDSDRIARYLERFSLHLVEQFAHEGRNRMVSLFGPFVRG